MIFHSPAVFFYLLTSFLQIAQFPFLLDISCLSFVCPRPCPCVIQLTVMSLHPEDATVELCFNKHTWHSVLSCEGELFLDGSSVSCHHLWGNGSRYKLPSPLPIRVFFNSVETSDNPSPTYNLKCYNPVQQMNLEAS